MTQEDSIIIPRWFLENVENTLRIQNNINLDRKTGETCQDRNVRGSLNGVRKLLDGEELTGIDYTQYLDLDMTTVIMTWSTLTSCRNMFKGLKNIVKI